MAAPTSAAPPYAPGVPQAPELVVERGTVSEQPAMSSEVQ